MNVLVYLDEGVGPVSSLLALKGLREVLTPYSLIVKTINRFALANTSWEEETLLLVFPGGRDVPYHTFLQGKGNAKIAAFVEKGGAYLGLCAGAYYGSAAVEFEKGNLLEVCASRELAFFPGVAIGPAYGPNIFCYGSEKGSRAALIKWEGPELTSREYVLYFNGGCYFSEAEKYTNTKVLARYSDLYEQPAAIVQCRVGKGKALLCGVHPEYDFTALNPRDPYSHPVAKALKDEEQHRQAFWRFLVTSLLKYSI